MHEIVAEVSGYSTAPRERVFETILGVDTRTLFTGYGLAGSVTGFRDVSGPWDTAGRTRRVLMSDGSSHTEELLYIDRPQSFGFELRDATGPLGWLTHGAHGHWRFDESGDGRTLIRWRYVFRAKDAVPYPIGWALLRILWSAYMRAALDRAIAQTVDGTAAPR